MQAQYDKPIYQQPTTSHNLLGEFQAEIEAEDQEFESH